MPNNEQKSDLDAALLRYKEGDDGAFDVIIEEMRIPLIFFINGFVNNPAEAEDIAMDVFAALLLDIDKFKFKSSLSTFLFALARNKAVDYVRRHKRTVPLTDYNASDSSFSELWEEYVRDEEVKQLRRELSMLPEKYRTVLYLHYYEEMDIDRIATVMKMNKKQIYNLLSRARAELKKRMKGG